MSFRFREHRGQLEDSMATLVILDTFDSLVRYIKNVLQPFGVNVTPDIVKVHLYMEYPDNRIGWQQTYMVSLEGYGVFGFTDQMVEGDEVR